MEFQIDPHTLERAEERGASLNEIKEVIETDIFIKAKSKRLAKYKVFNFQKKRNKKFYEQKK